MRILHIYPEYPDTFWSYKHALRFVVKRAVFPPLGALTVAALLPPGWEQRLVDMNVARLTDGDLLWADYVMISAMSIQRASTRAVIERCRALGVKTIAGGPDATANPDAFHDVDHLVLNEAEVTLPPFLADLRRGQAGRIYTSPAWADLTKTPPPRWDLLQLRRYASMSVQYSRGCPFDCEFCEVTVLYGRTPRTKEPAQLLAELDGLRAAGWRGQVFFVDDNFIGNKAKVKRDILPALDRWGAAHGYPFTFNTEASVNLADDGALLQAMARARFTSIFVGIETPHADSLDECGKQQNAQRDLLASIRRIQQHGLQVQAGFILGFDHDPVSILDRMVAFIQESGITTAMVGLLNAPRGTRLHQRLAREGRLLREMTGNNTDGSMNFVPKMDPVVLQAGYRSVVETIYAPRHYYARVRRFLASYRPVRWKGSQLKAGHLWALLRSAVVLGMLEPERPYYWRLVFWTLFRHPRLFPMAITLSIYGFHFRKCFASEG